MSKAVITRKKGAGGSSIVEVAGCRVGTAIRHKAALGAAPWWTFCIDEKFRTRPEVKTENHASADRLREAAALRYERTQRNKLSEFDKGVFYAVSMLQTMGDDPVLAADILKASGLSDRDCSDFDEMDKEALRVVNQEHDMALTGLD